MELMGNSFIQKSVKTKKRRENKKKQRKIVDTTMTKCKEHAIQ